LISFFEQEEQPMSKRLIVFIAVVPLATMVLSPVSASARVVRNGSAVGAQLQRGSITPGRSVIYSGSSIGRFVGGFPPTPCQPQTGCVRR
jgi:hypothetical protein